nr:diaminopimelate epimerase [Williamsia sterculiae]
MTSRAPIPFLKGHGTQNDFVVLPDPEVTLSLRPESVVALCDRRRGLGADGLLRVARAGALVDAGVLDGLPTGVTADDWFMDYRNADGSIAEMCGNGVRVFAHFLTHAGLVTGAEFTVGSRAGARPVHVHSAHDGLADVSVDMGTVTVGPESKATVARQVFGGVVVDVGNPHLACVVDELDPRALAALDLTSGVEFDTAVFPTGANVEVITAPRDGRVHMRVFERGVGETRSCGTGIVATAAAALRAEGRDIGRLTVVVPGGEVQAWVDGDGSGLRGPSELVAEGVLGPAWHAALR